MPDVRAILRGEAPLSSLAHSGSEAVMAAAHGQSSKTGLGGGGSPSSSFAQIGSDGEQLQKRVASNVQAHMSSRYVVLLFALN